MNRINVRFFLALFLISNISYAALFLAQTGNDGLSIALASASPSNSANIITEGNSTFSNSTSEGDVDQQNIATITVIPNPNSDSKPTATTATASSPNTTALDTNQSDLVNLTDTNTKPEKKQSSSLPESTAAMDDTKNQQSDSVNTSSDSNEMQRGEYLVDNNGIHYYNINNCSLVKGSSGIGDLSECEDAEREIQEEMAG